MGRLQPHRVNLTKPAVITYYYTTVKSPYLKILLVVIIPTILILAGACYFPDNVGQSQPVGPSQPERPSQPEGPSDAGQVSVPAPEAEPVFTEEGFGVYNEIQPPYYGADPDKTVILYNNEAAVNPTWGELKDFLISDKTDENNYLPGLRVCAEFAAELHNNAERAGIRAGWVAIHFADDSVGHALNVFETTNAGLVFIDNTGGIPIIETSTISEDSFTSTNEESSCAITHDKKAYVQIGRQLGVIGLDVPASFDYESYIDYTNDWYMLESRMELVRMMVKSYETTMETYQRRGDEYETELDGRTVIEDPEEYQKLLKMQEELEQMYSEMEEERLQLNTEVSRINREIENLGNCWREPLGIVESVEIYW